MVELVLGRRGPIVVGPFVHLVLYTVRAESADDVGAVWEVQEFMEVREAREVREVMDVKEVKGRTMLDRFKVLSQLCTLQRTKGS